MENQIAKTQSGDSEMQTSQGEAKSQSMQVYRPRGWLLPVAVTGGVAAVGGAGFWWLLWASHAFVNIVDAHTFLVSGTLTLALLIVALVQACVYWSQRGIMRGQWEAMIDALKQATRQADIASDALLINNRASVGVHSIQYDRKKKIVFVKIENIGHVPAKDIQLFLRITVALPLDLSMAREGEPHHRIEKNYGGTELFRGNLQIIIPIRLGRFLSREEIAAIEAEDDNNDALILISGNISYTDGFAGQPRKRTQFFFIYDPTADCWFADAPEGWNALFDMETPTSQAKETKPN